jgi:hypothetical protein
VRVELVDDVAVGVETVERVRVGAERFELRSSRSTWRLFRYAFTKRFSSGLLHHRRGGVPDDLRLVLLRGARVDLGAGLAVGDEQVQAQRGGDSGDFPFLRGISS